MKIDMLPEFMDLDVSDLAGQVERPEQFILETACELKGWSLQGQYPHYRIEQWVQVTVNSDGLAFYRLLNARTHKRLVPMTVRGLYQGITEELERVKSWQTDPDTFLSRLYEAWQTVQHQQELSGPVPLSDIYFHLYKQQTTYAREYFGLDLNRLRELSHPTIDGLTLKVFTSDSPAKAFSLLDYAAKLEVIGALDFIPFTSEPEEESLPAPIQVAQFEATQLVFNLFDDETFDEIEPYSVADSEPFYLPVMD